MAQEASSAASQTIATRRVTILNTTCRS
jgi:hypothetical protein